MEEQGGGGDKEIREKGNQAERKKEGGEERGRPGES